MCIRACCISYSWKMWHTIYNRMTNITFDICFIHYLLICMNRRVIKNLLHSCHFLRIMWYQIVHAFLHLKTILYLFGIFCSRLSVFCAFFSRILWDLHRYERFLTMSTLNEIWLSVFCDCCHVLWGKEKF